MCIGCRQSKPKRELIRLVRTLDGELVVDETGRQNGRGAYLCPDKACWEEVLRGGQIAKALKIEIGEREKQILQEFATRYDLEGLVNGEENVVV
jgi:predicted RNA-binding protein YlxR (DUF448 family)